MDLALRTCLEEPMRANAGTLVLEDSQLCHPAARMHFRANLLGSNSWQHVRVCQKHYHFLARLPVQLAWL
jgi:hypothetical protein